MEIIKYCKSCADTKPHCLVCGSPYHCAHMDDFITELYNVNTEVIDEDIDADISNPPEEVTWYPINDPNASWNLPK